MMKSITRDEVNAALKKHLQVENIKFAIVTGEAETLRQSLVSGAPSPITYPTEKSEEILAEDETIAAYPFPVAEDAVEVVPVDQIFQD
jgi:zinc protease